MKRFMYYLIQWTWGIIMNIFGSITCIIALCCKCPIQKYRNAIEILVPWNFGGCELGMFFIRGKDCPGVAPHEYGHTIQNLWWGPLFPFVVCLPSAARYWLREQKGQNKKHKWIAALYSMILFVALIIFAIGLTGLYGFMIFAGFIVIYGSMLFGWLLWFETPKYENTPPRYDDIWFEGQATELGNRANNNEWDWL